MGKCPHEPCGAADGFDWDAGNRSKCRKHGVSLDEIEALLSDVPRMAPDLKHSLDEDRYIAVGRNEHGRPLFVVFTFRERGGKRLIPPLNTRYVHKKEIAAYEEKSPAVQKR